MSRILPLTPFVCSKVCATKLQHTLRNNSMLQNYCTLVFTKISPKSPKTWTTNVIQIWTRNFVRITGIKIFHYPTPPPRYVGDDIWIDLISLVFNMFFIRYFQWFCSQQNQWVFFPSNACSDLERVYIIATPTNPLANLEDLTHPYLTTVSMPHNMTQYLIECPY